MAMKHAPRTMSWEPLSYNANILFLHTSVFTLDKTTGQKAHPDSLVPKNSPLPVMLSDWGVASAKPPQQNIPRSQRFIFRQNNSTVPVFPLRKHTLLLVHLTFFRFAQRQRWFFQQQPFKKFDPLCSIFVLEPDPPIALGSSCIVVHLKIQEFCLNAALHRANIG